MEPTPATPGCGQESDELQCILRCILESDRVGILYASLADRCLLCRDHTSPSPPNPAEGVDPRRLMLVWALPPLPGTVRDPDPTIVVAHLECVPPAVWSAIGITDPSLLRLVTHLRDTLLASAGAVINCFVMKTPCRRHHTPPHL